MSRIRDLLDLPDAVRKGQFVLSLAYGVDHPDETVKTYAITQPLVHAFEHALSIVDSALKGGRSQLAVLHGSFGSGKSHFMAILDLMLSGHEAPWTRSEFHPLRAKFDWVGDRKMLQLPLHMIGAESVEQKVFAAYVEFVTEHHPAAPLPALYADQDLFDNARGLRETMGDDRFFEKLNEGAAGAAGWGKRAGSWDGDRFDSAVVTDDIELRGELFSVLVKTHFPAFAGQTHRFIELDRGLEVLANHAKALDYDAVVIYLDELILWLAGKVADIKFVADQLQTLSKLKEAQNEKREIPIVSFIARQRDIADLVGREAAGNVHTMIKDSQSWFSGRRETIKLEDRNLPAVVAHRVVKARDNAAEQLIDDRFATLPGELGSAWGTLLGAHGTKDDFRQVYPFSPALLDALVAVSDCLQRERTAIRVLMELLVDHLPELELGQVVPVGDIFDVLAAGEDAFDPVMQDRFNRARDLYRNQLLPIIQEDNDTASRDACQRLRPDHRADLGCSGCPQTACRNDNRLAKTLLLAGFVPHAAPFENLTVSKLVELNPGSVIAPIPGTEVSETAEKLQNWATKISQLQVGEQADPGVSVQLEGVDLRPILDSAREADQPGARKRLLQEMLFAALDIAYAGQSTVEKVVTWRGTKRAGALRFGNVRTLHSSAFECPADAEWYVIVDYPFDDAGFTPQHDVERIEAIREELGGRDNPTFAWLPSFFSERVEREVGQLAVVEHILDGGNSKRYLGHLRPEDQASARMGLDSLKSQKRARIRKALIQAYGLTSKVDEELIDASRSIDESLISLQPGLPARPMLAAGFEDALGKLADRLLEHRYPHHPHFGATVTYGHLEKVRKIFDRVLDAPDQRLILDQSDVKEARDYGVPLSLIRLSENVAKPFETRLKEVDQRRVQDGVANPTVEQVREYIDPEHNLGYVREASDLMVYAYASWSGRSLEKAGCLYELDRVGKLGDEVDLVLGDLPSEEEWNAAITMAGSLLGVAQPERALSSRNLGVFSQRVSGALEKHRGVERLADVLQPRLATFASGIEAPRLETARSARELLAGLIDQRGVDRAQFLSAFKPVTSKDALERCLTSGMRALRELEDESRWINFRSVQKLRDDPERRLRAEALMEELTSTLTADQLNADLGQRLDALTKEAGALLHVEPSPPLAGWESIEVSSVRQEGDASKVIDAAVTELKRALDDLQLEGELKLDVDVRLRRRRKDKEES